MAYVCSELEKGGKPFSEIVREAREKGYTEPHPLDDLSGEDVRRKLVILLRSAGIGIEESDVELEGVVNAEKYAGLSPEAFLEAIREDDSNIEKRVADELSQGNVPRYVAEYDSTGEKAKMEVSLKFVPKDSELGLLKGTANKVLIRTSLRTPDETNPHIIQSPGAGTVKTAASVRADLLSLLSNTSLWTHS